MSNTGIYTDERFLLHSPKDGYDSADRIKPLLESIKNKYTGTCYIPEVKKSYKKAPAA